MSLRSIILGAFGKPVGQAEYTTPGTFSLTVPPGVTSICGAAVGAGGGGANNAVTGSNEYYSGPVTSLSVRNSSASNGVYGWGQTPTLTGFSGSYTVNTAGIVDSFYPSDATISSGGVFPAGQSTTAVTLSGGGGSGASFPNVILQTRSFRLGAVTLTQAGSGYTSAPAVTVNCAGGYVVQPTATCTVSGGQITSVTITNPSTNEVYIVDPFDMWWYGVTLSFSGGGGSGGMGYTNTGAITVLTKMISGGLSTTSDGSGYTSTPSLSFSGASTQPNTVVNAGKTITSISAISGGGNYAYPGPGNDSIYAVGASVLNRTTYFNIGGGWGYNSYSNYIAAGGGGRLRWENDIPVTPGETLTITVPAGGAAGADGGDAIISGSFGTIIAGGGKKGTSSTGGAGGTSSGTYTGSNGGGNGGSGGVGQAQSTSYTGGGGGAGGYTGAGGNGGGTNASGTNGDGGAGGGASGKNSASGSTRPTSAGGGGVGIRGAGTSGLGGTSNGANSVGGGGSNGSSGGNTSGTVKTGGAYGGGGGPQTAGEGGAVRVIWGENRGFPSLNTGDM